MNRALTAVLVLLATAGSQAAVSQAADTIRVPEGSFMMGSDHGPADERPRHRVVLSAFVIDRWPVTNAAFAEFLNAAGARASTGERWFDADDPDARIHAASGKWIADPGFADHPVVEVPWAGAREYCAWRKKRLPTEAEWEKAARGMDERRYPWGNDAPDARRAHYAAGYNQTAPVTNAAAGASPFGVEDLAGNAWEWVSSLYLPYPYRADDGREDLAADGVRGTRGGGHDSPAHEITTTQRGRSLSRNPRSGHHNIGFRCAASI